MHQNAIAGLANLLAARASSGLGCCLGWVDAYILSDMADRLEQLTLEDFNCFHHSVRNSAPFNTKFLCLPVFGMFYRSTFYFFMLDSLHVPLFLFS